MTGIHQLTIVIDAEYQGSKILTTCSGRRKSADHCFLPGCRFYFQPVPATGIRLINGLSVFCDNSFKALFFGRFKKIDAGFFYMITEAYNVVSWNNGPQYLFSCNK